MAKLANTSITSYSLALGKDFKNQHVKVHYGSPVGYSGLEGSYYSLRLKSTEYGLFSYSHYIMFTKFINKFKSLKKITYLSIRPYVNTTRKPAEVRMGKGKGKFDKKVAFIAPGSFILEVRLKLAENVDLATWEKQKKIFLKDCMPMLSKFSEKLPVKTIVVSNDI